MRAAPRPLAVFALLAAATLIYAPSVFGPPFYTKGEPREAVVVQRMLRDGDFVLPHRTATEIPTKPPLFHWLGAAVSALAGRVSEASVRIPSVAASLLVLQLTLRAGYLIFNRDAAWIAVVALATSPQWIASSVTARVDMALAAAIAVAMFNLQSAHRQRAPWPDTFWLACALGVLVKGPVALVLPTTCALTFLGWQRDFRYLATIRLRRALLLLAVPATWYVLAWHRGGEVFLQNVVSENVVRMIGADAGEDMGHRHSALFYAPALLAGLAPWSLVLVAAIVELARGYRTTDETHAFLLAWLVVTVLFFCLAASKRSVYLLSCYPAAALLIGDWIKRRDGPERSRTTVAHRTAAWIVRIVATLLGVAAVALALQSVGVPTLNALQTILSPGDAANLVAVARSLESHRLLVIAWAASVLVLLGTCERSVVRRACRTAFGMFALVAAATTMIYGATVLRDLAVSQSVKTFITDAVTRVPGEQPLYFYAGTEGQPDLFFYKSFEYAAGFYAAKPLVLLTRIDVSAPGTTWFITTEQALAELERSPDATAGELRLRELARFTYGDNPRRAPVLFVEATTR